MSIGVILAPISPNYTLMPGGLARLKDIAEALRPNFVFVQSGRDFSAGRSIPELAAATWISVDGAPDTVPFAVWCAARDCWEFTEALWNTESGGGDVDTTCAMVGGIVALAAGAESIPVDWLRARGNLPVE